MSDGFTYLQPDEYVLIRSRITYPNPDVGTVETVDWYQAVETRYRGQVRRGWGYWARGAHTSFTDYDILETVTCPGGRGLDLTKTTIHQQLVAERERRRGGADWCGWLSPTAEWHPCEYHAHDRYATYVLDSTISELQREGWLRLDKDAFSLQRPSTDAQAAWMLEREDAWLNSSD